ncbi:MAG: IS66 family transposase [Crocinitomicaceae bacterium]|nr:IS66 family transposase [Crocinitomicaceae bacterium]
MQEQNLQIQKLQHQIDQLLRTVFGKKSERFTPNIPEQMVLPLDIKPILESEVQKETITYERQKSNGKSNHKGRLPIPDHLEREEIKVKTLENTDGLVKIGEEITEQLEYKPGKLYVKRYIREKFAKPNGEGVLIAPLPNFIIQRGMAGSGLLAWIIIQKYVDHLPLYRQIEQFKRFGMPVPSSTMSDWVAMSLKELTPLYEVFKREILGSNYLQADETPIKVLDEKKKGESHRGFYWVYRDPQSGLVLFDYRESRSREGPTEILKDFKGYLQSDGYSAYENFDKGKITLIHCMAHARRYFQQALDNDRKRAEHALKEIQELYLIERFARENHLSHVERFDIRQEGSMPILKNLHSWLKENYMQVTPQSAIGKAISYSLSRWDKLMIYASDGRLEIDNNLIENSIRPIAIGRKNYLFAGSHDAARRAAMIYSLLGTCKLKGVEPFAWLKNVFEVLPDWKANQLAELLP